ncbi:hypothetical protein OH492_19270 [Vibrio chagasii]|nr:hypothetical protein [Vibrio chagasii]
MFSFINSKTQAQATTALLDGMTHFEQLGCLGTALKLRSSERTDSFDSLRRTVANLTSKVQQLVFHNADFKMLMILRCRSEAEVGRYNALV